MRRIEGRGRRARGSGSLRTRRTEDPARSAYAPSMSKTRSDDDVRGQPYIARLLASAGGTAEVTDLFDRAQLPVGEFYAQLAWEVKRGLIVDDHTSVLRSPPPGGAA